MVKGPLAGASAGKKRAARHNKGKAGAAAPKKHAARHKKRKASSQESTSALAPEAPKRVKRQGLLPTNIDRRFPMVPMEVDNMEGASSESTAAEIEATSTLLWLSSLDSPAAQADSQEAESEAASTLRLLRSRRPPRARKAPQRYRHEA
jgi:hypothetical protein